MKILYLEDSEADVKYISRYMSTVNHKFQSVNTMDDALDVLQNEHPDVFLVDIVIGENDAYDLISYAVNNHLAKHVVAVTAKTLPTERQYCLDLGCTWVISKPFTIDELENVLESLAV